MLKSHSYVEYLPITGSHQAHSRKEQDESKKYMGHGGWIQGSKFLGITVQQKDLKEKIQLIATMIFFLSIIKYGTRYKRSRHQNMEHCITHWILLTRKL